MKDLGFGSYKDYCFRFAELESKSFDAIDELTQRGSQAEAASSGGEDSNRVPPAALRQLVWRSLGRRAFIEMSFHCPRPYFFRST